MALGTDVGDKGNDVLSERLIKLTDEILNNPASDSQLINLFQVQVFERLVGSRQGAQLAKKFLHGKSVQLLEQTLEHYHTDEFLEEYKNI
jgi:hypothetical protein